MNIEYNLRGILHAFFKHKKKFIIIFLLFLISGLYLLFNAVPVFESRGSMLVKFGQGARPEMNMPDNRPIELARNDRKEIIESYVRILQSHDLLSDVASDVGIERLYPSMNGPSKELATQNAVMNLLDGDMNIYTGDESNLIEVYVENGDPAIAAQFAKKLMEMFIIRQAEVYNNVQSSFLDTQIEAMRDRLAKSREKLRTFKGEKGISAIDEEMAELLKEKTSLSTAAFQSTTEAQIQSATEAQTALAQIKSEQADMRATYKPDSPLLKQMNESVAIAKKELYSRQADVRAKGSATNSLKSKIASINQRISWLEQQRGEYNELEQQIRMDEENYQYYQQRGEEARVNNLLNSQNITRISIIDTPTASPIPVRPNKKLILLAFLMAGMLCGLAAVLISEVLDDRLITSDQVRAATGLPVLASFSKAKRRKKYVISNR